MAIWCAAEAVAVPIRQDMRAPEGEVWSNDCVRFEPNNVREFSTCHLAKLALTLGCEFNPSLVSGAHKTRTQKPAKTS